jgi:predicted dehydrogenase
MRSSTNSKYGVGILGTNFGYTVVAPAIIKSSCFELICVANSSAATPGEYFPESTILRASNTELITNPEVDVVWVSTPPETHFGLLKEVSSSRKIAICEKPCGSSINELTAINSLSMELGIPIFINFEFRYDPIYTRIFNDAKKIQDDEFFRFTVNWQTYANMRNHKSYSRRDFFLDFVIHVLDCFLNFADDIGAQLISAEENRSKCSVCENYSENCTAINVLFDRFSLETIICRKYTGVGIHKIELLSNSLLVSSGIMHPFSSDNLFYFGGNTASVNPDRTGELNLKSKYSDMRVFSIGLLLEDIVGYMRASEESYRPPKVQDALRVQLLIDQILESSLI